MLMHFNTCMTMHVRACIGLEQWPPKLCETNRVSVMSIINSTSLLRISTITRKKKVSFRIFLDV